MIYIYQYPKQIDRESTHLLFRKSIKKDEIELKKGSRTGLTGEKRLYFREKAVS